MLSSIQTVNNVSGNQAPRSTSVPLSTDTAASEDKTAASDEFAALLAAFMPVSPAPLSAGVQTEAEAGKPRFADTKGATIPGPDAAKTTLDPISVGALERVTRPESNAPLAGSVATDGPDLTAAPTAARVAVQLMTEAVTDRPATTQVPSLPGDEGESGLHPITNLGAVEGSTAVRALPPDLPMRPATPASSGDSVAWPGDPDDETFSSTPSPSVGLSEAPGLEQEIPAAAKISAEPARDNRVGHTPLPAETPSPGETEDATGTFHGTMIIDPPPGSAPIASPGSGTLTAPQGNPSVESTQSLSETPAEILRQNIRHIAETTRHLDRGAIEITLSPEELGHVRLTVKSHDITGTTVVLQADRPETLDLMRRHVDLLAQDMRDFGYRELTFAFQDRRPSDHEAPSVGRNGDDGAAGSSAAGKVPGGAMTAASRPAIQDGRLDIRL